MIHVLAIRIHLRKGIIIGMTALYSEQMKEVFIRAGGAMSVFQARL